MPSRAPAVAAGCPADVAPDPHRCFHCGERNPRGSPWRLDVDGSVATFCCAGCLAVAQTIDAAGLTAFYQRRALATVPCNADDDDFVRAGEAATAGGLIVPVDEGRCDVALLLEGLRCGACVWLLETWLARQPGICEASVNFATRRARVRFDPAVVDVAQILRTISAIGYRAHPYDPKRREALVRRESRALLLRMGLALLGMMQVMMFAVPGYVSADGVDTRISAAAELGESRSCGTDRRVLGRRILRRRLA